MAHLTLRADCTYKCRSAQHTREMIIAASQPVIEADLVAWIGRHCYGPGRTRDPQGRSLLHVAASRGLTRLLAWLLKYKEAALNGKDTESGYSALHRAVFYGQIRTVVFLIKQGANLWLTDNSGLTALDHAVLDRPPHVEYSRLAPLEVYVWGVNSNYNLGLGHNTARNNPDLVEQFRRQNLSIRKVALQKFHSAFLSRTGVVLTCGHGRGGRLGHGSETMQLTPRPVQQLSHCVDVALGVDHSVFLTEGGVVYTCGENSYHQLGHQPPPARLLAPAPVGGRGPGVKLAPAVGVAAGRYHSVFWTEEAVYTWGLNAGQLGHLKGDKTVILPKLVAAIAGKDTKIEKVEVSDGATVLLTGKGEVMALHQYAVKKLGARQHGIQKIQVIGGHLDPAVDPGGLADIDFKLVAGGGTNLRVFLLSKIGKITVWEEKKENSFIPCILSLSRSPPLLTDMALFRDGLLLVSQEGEAWTASWPVAQHQAAASKRAVSPLSTPRGSAPVSLKLKRISHAHRAVAAICDSKGRNFCVLQVSPVEALTEIPEICPSRLLEDLAVLLDGTDEYDNLCDTVCRVGSRRYALHSFVLAAGSETLCKQLKFAEAISPTVLEIEAIEPVIFEQVVRYLYTRTCPLLVEGPCTVHLEAKKPDVEAAAARQQQSDDNENFIRLGAEEDPYAMSAFAVYSDRNRGKRKNNKRSNQQQQQCTAAEVAAAPLAAKSANPLVLLQEAAKSLGIAGLVKIVDCFRYTDGMIERKTRPPRAQLALSAHSLSELADVTIESEDGEEIFAHKCILAARSEYFLGMFSSGWSEAGQESRLRLPVKADYIEAVLEYLYADEVRSLAKSEDTEFISNVLVVADQFLLTRLKEMCENQLSKLITLKNVGDFLQFSLLYLAHQLEVSCLQFVSLNLPAVLESKILEGLDEEILNRLDAYYQQLNPVFTRRRIQPYSGHPTKEDIEKELAASPLSLEEEEAVEGRLQVDPKSRPRRHSSGDKKALVVASRHRRTSAESSGSGSDSDDSNLAQETERLSILDFDIEEKEEGSGEVPFAPSPCPPPIRDKSFFAAILASEQPSAQTATVLESAAVSPIAGRSASVAPMVSPPVSKTAPETPMKKFPKLSQKERKRLQSASSCLDSNNSPATVNGAEEVKTTAWVGWATPGKKGAAVVVGADSDEVATPSLTAIMQVEAMMTRPGGEVVRQRRTSDSDPKPAETPVKKSAWKQLDWSSVEREAAVSTASQSPKVSSPPANPWGRHQPAASSSSSSPQLVSPAGQPANRSFAEIMAQDAKEKEVLHKVRSKPLHLTQIEEKAIEELKRFYSSHHLHEIITVERVERGVAATPVWQKQKKPPAL